MARTMLETLAPVCGGPSSCLALTTSVVLDDSATPGALGPWPAQAQLVSLVSDPDARQRLGALAASIARGQKELESVAPEDWRRPLVRRMPFETGPQTSWVIAVPGSRRKELDYLPPPVDDPQLSPLVVVTDRPELFRDLPLFRPFGIVKAASDDLLGTAMAVYRMMVCLLAPETYACTDTEDIMAVFAQGPYAQLCVASWSPDAGIVFASAQDKGTVEGARGVLARIDLDGAGSLRASMDAFRQVRALCHPDATAILLGAVGMFVAADVRSGLRTIPLLCVR